MSLKELKPEKYWDYPSSIKPEEKKIDIYSRIFSNEYISSVKKDGHYYRTVKENGELFLQSRGISVNGTYTDKKEFVPYISESLKKLPNNTILIGELYQHGKNSNTMTSILGCGLEKSLQRQEGEYGRIFYYIHDVWYYNGESLLGTPYEKRIKYVKAIYEKFFSSNPFIECAEYTTTSEAIKEMLEKAREDNEEGIVLVKKNALVEPGKRTSKKTIKVKRELDNYIDCFFTGNYKLPNRMYDGKEIEDWTFWENNVTGEKLLGYFYNRYESGEPLVPVKKPYFYNWAGAVEIGVYRGDEVVSLGYISNIPDEIKKGFVENNEGMKFLVCKVNAMQFTENNLLRHGRIVEFRTDIPATDCTWEKIFEN